MKRSIQLSILILIGFLTGLTAQNNSIEITFNATYQGEILALDSVFIQNLTQQTDTVLSDPENPLVLEITTGLNGSSSLHNEVFKLRQNTPNPFGDRTTFNLLLPGKGEVELIVRTTLGQRIAVQNIYLEAGSHGFTFYPGNDRFYLLSASFSGVTSSVKMIHHGSNAAQHAALVYTGMEHGLSDPQHKSSGGGFMFSPGDTLRFTGYAETPVFTLGSDEIEDSPVTSQTYTFEILEGIRCPGNPKVTDIEGNVYNTVYIGDQCWMKENLKTTKYSNGTPIEYPGTNNAAWENDTAGAYAWYDNDINWKYKYGALYNWYATDNVNGLCPVGWHVPTEYEWTVLTDHIGGTVSPNGNKLKSCRQVNSPLGGDCSTSEHPRWSQHNTHYGTDDYGFSGLPGGNRNFNGTFSYIGSFGDWGSSTEYSSTHVRVLELGFNVGTVPVESIGKHIGLSVRCLRD